MLLFMFALAVEPPSHSQHDSQTAPMVFSSRDYPKEAFQNRLHGEVRAKLRISKEGRVSACHIVKSSGLKRLDNATCKILIERSRFMPARDRFGRPTEDTFLTPPIVWRIEK